MTISNSSNTAFRYMQTVERRTKVYEANAVAQGEVIEMIQMFSGEEVVDVHLHYDALGSGTQLSVGDGGVAARYIGTTTATTAGRANLSTAADVGPGYKYTADDTIDVSVVTGPISGTIRVTVLFMRSF